MPPKGLSGYFVPGGERVGRAATGGALVTEETDVAQPGPQSAEGRPPLNTARYT